MRRLSISVAAAALVVALSPVADAADLQQAPLYKAPPPQPAPVYSWNGWYVGLNAGAAFSDNDVNTIGSTSYVNLAHSDALANATASALGATANIPLSTTSFIGGGQIGYNWQIMNAWVAGLETDIAGLIGGNNIGTAQIATPIPGVGTNSSAITVTRDLQFLGTFRGRVGFLATPTFLLYGTGGLAYGGVDLSTDVVQSRGPRPFGTPVSGGTSSSDTRVGWTAGAGAEWMFLPNWSAKVEYLHYDLGQASDEFNITHYNAQGALIFVNNVRTEATMSGDIVRAGVNYHFNW